MLGLETERQRIGEVARSTETVSRGLEAILQIWRLGGYFCGAHVALAPPPLVHSVHVRYKITENIIFN